MSAAPDVTSRKVLSILIVQLGEIEEVFRSLMAVKAVKHLYPEMKFHFIVRPENSTPLKRVDWIERVFETPVLQAETAVKNVAAWVDQVVDCRYDILTNWTFAAKSVRMSALITTLIPAAVKFGNHTRSDFTVASFDAWSIYRESWLRDPTIDQDIHHTDIVTTQLLTALQVHAGEPQSETGGAVTTKNFFKVSPADLLTNKTMGRWVAVHPDSLDFRFEETVEMILRRHPDIGVVLLNESEWTDSEETFKDHPRVVNLCGRLNFDSTVSILSQCTWLISGRAPIVDLANLLNVRTVYWIEAQPSITGEADRKWTETGPYGNGTISVRFREEFQPELLYGIWSHYQSEWFHHGSTTLEKHLENLGLKALADGMEVYRSKIRTPQEGGGVSYESVLAGELAFDTWMFRLRGQVARAWFCGWVPAVESEVEKLSLNPTMIKRAREVRDSLSVIEQICSEGKAVSEKLKNCAATIKNPNIMKVEDREQIDAHAKKLLELEAFLSRVVKVEPQLNGFYVWYQHFMHHLHGETLEEMAKETFQAFDLVAEGSELISAYTQKVLNRAKPRRVDLVDLA